MDDLGDQERAVLRAVTANPFAGQQEIADALGVARSTVAAHIAQLQRKGYVLGRAYVLPEPKRIACIGGATLDRKYLAPAAVQLGTSNPVQGRRSFGGVARNVVENLARLGVRTSLATIVGDDENGRTLVRHLDDLGVDTSRIHVAFGKRTGEYCAVLAPDSSLVLGIADMDIFDHLAPADLERAWPALASAAWVLADCNLRPDVLKQLIARRHGARFRLAVDTVSVPKAARLPADLAGVDVLFLNLDEADAYLRATGRDGATDPAAAAAALRDAGAAAVILTLGARGLLVAAGDRTMPLPAFRAAAVDVTGAGDALIAGTLYRLLAGDGLVDAAREGALLAALTTETEDSVHPELSPRLLDGSRRRAALSA